MLAEYVPGGVWTPAARVVAVRRLGVTDTPLVLGSIALEAGLSAIAGVLVFAVSLATVSSTDAPVWWLAAFAVVVAVLLHPRCSGPRSPSSAGRWGAGGAERCPGRWWARSWPTTARPGCWPEPGCTSWPPRSATLLHRRFPTSAAPARRAPSSRCWRCSRRRVWASAKAPPTVCCWPWSARPRRWSGRPPNRLAITLVEALLLLLVGVRGPSLPDTEEQAVEPEPSVA